MSKFLEPYSRYMKCQLECSKNGSSRNNDIKPFVTISRQAGAGGITVGEKLTEYLAQRDKQATCPWTVFDKSLVKHTLEEHNLPESFAEYMSEKKTSEIKDIIETMVNLHPSTYELVHRTSKTILNLAQMGNVVIVGRGANLITRRLAGGFHVRLVGSAKKRLHHIQEFRDLSPAEAEKTMKAEDKGRADYIKQNFDKNIEDSLLYDVVINTDYITYDEAARMIGDQVLAQRARVAG